MEQSALYSRILSCAGYGTYRACSIEAGTLCYGEL